MTLEHLFQPLKVGRMEIANRIMMPGMAAGMVLDDDGEAAPEMVAYYLERAANRPGMMGIGAAAVVPSRIKRSNPLAIDDDRHIFSLAAFVAAVHRHDTRFGIQLWNGGNQAGDGEQLSPSGIPANARAAYDATGSTPTLKVLDLDEIRHVVRCYADGAERCLKAGFDFVEIHAGHGYLISNFMSPHFNRRTDQYGGSFENRTRFLLEILSEVKARVGDRMAVGVKMNGDDFMEDQGWTLADACRIAPVLERKGADYLSISAGIMGAPRLTVPPLYEKQGCFADLAAAVKRQVRIPVAAVGRIKDPIMADALVRDGQADIACMGRAIIADPDLVGKAREGRLAEIRPCLAECRGCIDQQMRTIMRGQRIESSCIVNPRVARELICIDIEGERKDAPRRILVVGTGCAGLEAARRSAFSGHNVMLCEQRGWIGGQLRFAAMMPGRHEIGDIVPWYQRQLSGLGVEVRLNHAADSALLAAIRPDVVVVATGSRPVVPQDLPGLPRDTPWIDIVTADDLLEHRIAVGENVLVLGGDQIGMEIADYLADGKRCVTVAETAAHFAAKLALNDRWYLIGRTIKKQVKRVKNVRALAPHAERGIALITAEGREVLPQIDTIVLASQRQPERGFAEIARAAGYETHVIGDAADMESEDSGTIFANIAQAYHLARRL
jgi:2,4-dienoyl-CoA reductase-like NADH-dependent reductase (Old Yellow Enzyme family)